jgi:hypothetical protein
MMRNIFTIFTAVSVCCLGLAVLVLLPPELKIQLGKRTQRPVTEAEPNSEFSEFYPDRSPSGVKTGRAAEVQESSRSWHQGKITAQRMGQTLESQVEPVAGGLVDSPSVVVSPPQAGYLKEERPAEDFQSGAEFTAEIRTETESRKEDMAAAPVSGITAAAVAAHTGVPGLGNVNVAVREQALEVVEVSTALSNSTALSKQSSAVAVPRQLNTRTAKTGNEFGGSLAPDDGLLKQPPSEHAPADALPSAATVVTAVDDLPVTDPEVEVEAVQNGQEAQVVSEDSQLEFQVAVESMAEPTATQEEFSGSEPAVSSEVVMKSVPVVAESVEQPSISGPEFDEFPEETDEEDLFAMELEKTGTGTALPAVSSGTQSDEVTQAEQQVVKAEPTQVASAAAPRSENSSSKKDCGEGQIGEWNQESVVDRRTMSEDADLGMHLAETPLSVVAGTVKGIAESPVAAAVVKSALLEDATDSDRVEILFDVSELKSARGNVVTKDSPAVSVVEEASFTSEESLPNWVIPQRMTVKGPRRVLVPELEFEEWVNHGIPRGGPEHGGTLVRPFTPQAISPMRLAVTRVRGSVEEAFERIPRLDFAMSRLIPFRSDNSSENGAGKSSRSTTSTVASGTRSPRGKSRTHVQPRPSFSQKPVVSGGQEISPPGGIVQAGWSTDESAIAVPRRISPPTAATGSQTQPRRMSPR